MIRLYEARHGEQSIFVKEQCGTDQTRKQAIVKRDMLGVEYDASNHPGICSRGMSSNKRGLRFYSSRKSPAGGYLTSNFRHLVSVAIDKISVL